MGVVGFTCKVGSRLITGLVKEKAKARAVYDAAISRGGSADGRAYSMAWDEAAGQLILFDIVSVVAPQTWIWTGSNWERKA